MALRRLAPSLVLWLFPVVVVVLIAAVVVAAFTWGGAFLDGDGFWPILQILAFPLIGAVFFGVRAAMAYKPEPAEGIELSPAEHPRLWAEIGELAAFAQTEPPTRIVIVGEVNAAVSESADQRELEIGLPLLATFTRGELRAVLAHELGHFAGGDTAESAKILRRLVFLHHVREKAGLLWRWLFTGYLQVFALAAGPAAREAELRADQLSVQAAGPETAAAAMRALVGVELTWQVLEDDYLSLFELAGRRASIREGMRSLLAANADRIEPAVARALAEERHRATDTHPPLRERIGRFEAAARAGGTGPAPTTEANLPAYELLSGGGAWLDDAEGQLAIQLFPLSSWDDVIVRAMRQQVDADAEQTAALARDAGLGDGSLHQLLSLIEKPDEELDDLVDALFAPVLSAMLSAGAARVAVLDDRGRLHGVRRLRTRHRRTARVRRPRPRRPGVARLAGRTRCRRGERPRQDRRSAVAGGREPLTGPWEGRRDVHLWTTGVLALPPLDKATINENKQQISDKHQHPRLYLARAEGIEAARRSPETLWWDADRIAGAEISMRMKNRLTITLADGDTVAMATTIESAHVGSLDELGDAVRYLGAPRA